MLSIPTPTKEIFFLYQPIIQSNPTPTKSSSDEDSYYKEPEDNSSSGNNNSNYKEPENNNAELAQNVARTDRVRWE